MSILKPARPVVTPTCVFHSVHRLLHEIDPRNHGQFGADSNCPTLVCYPDEPCGSDFLDISFQPTECLVRSFAVDNNAVTVIQQVRVQYRDPNLLHTIFATLDGHGLHVPEHVLPIIHKKQRELTGRKRQAASHAAIRRRR